MPAINHSRNGPLSKKPLLSDEKETSLAPLFEELNALWSRAEAQIAELRVPHDVLHEVHRAEFGPEDGAAEGRDITFLGWSRHQRQWRICWVHQTDYYDDRPSEVEERPIAECPMDVRVDMTDHFEAFRRRMRKAQAEYLPKVASAVAQFRGALGE